MDGWLLLAGRLRTRDERGLPLLLPSRVESLSRCDR